MGGWRRRRGSRSHAAGAAKHPRSDRVLPLMRRAAARMTAFVTATTLLGSGCAGLEAPRVVAVDLDRPDAAAMLLAAFRDA